MGVINRLKYSLILFIIFSSIVLPQIKNIKLGFAPILETRLGNYLRSDNNINPASTSNNLPIFFFNPLDNWTSPKQFIGINGTSFDQFPFNFSSLHLLPIDIGRISLENIEQPAIGLFHSMPLSGLNIAESYLFPDSLKIKLRAYIGSETEDPLIHVFTRDKVEQGNKNKIPPSGSLSISNKINKTGYGITLGYYGNFSTGSVNDFILLKKNSYYINKQNKQISASAVINYKAASGKNISLSTSLMSFYGWDVPPFISSFIHFETYLYTIRASTKNLFNGFSFYLINDGSITEMHEGNGIPSAKFQLTKYSFVPYWQKSFDKFSLGLSLDLNLYLASNLANRNPKLTQKFFNEDIAKVSFGINTFSYLRISKSVFSNIRFRFDKHYIDKPSISGYVELNYSSGNDHVLFNISSITAFPNLTDMFGRFIQINNPNELLDTFKIRGNNELLKERVNYAGIEYYRKDDNLRFKIKLFAQNINGSIKQKTLTSIIAQSSGEILREAVYVNGDPKKTFGTNLMFNYEKKYYYKFFTDYTFTENSEIPYYPKHLIASKFELLLPIKSVLKFLFQYNSKTKWEEFIVKKEDDFFYNKSDDGGLNYNLSFDISYHQYLNDFYFTDSLILSLTIQNIFNNRIRYLPIGNYFDRTIIFSLYSEL